MHILGISAFYHDSAAALVLNGELAAAAQEERFSRRKHDPRFPLKATAACLRECGLSIRDIDLIAFYEQPSRKFRRVLATQAAFAPGAFESFARVILPWITDKYWIEEHLRRELACDAPVVCVPHHVSHAASAFFPSPFLEAGVLTVDGVGEWSTTSIGRGRGAHVALEKEIRFPHSLGLLYSAFTYYCGFRVNSGEYKLMGLAPYGTPRFADLILENLIDLKEDGSFRLNLEYFDYCVNENAIDEPAFEKLFGHPRRRSEGELDQFTMDVAASIQAVTEEAMLRLARETRNITGSPNLCLAGGVALNCVANGKILASGIFDEIWIQPAAGDAGGALGAALYAWHTIGGNPREPNRNPQKNSCLGPGFSDAEIREFLEAEEVPFTELRGDDLPTRVAELIAGENVVGWFQGRMEFGPRALGHRSILGDARSPRMQEVMNLKIKFRESFRPFAPIVLKEKAGEYFELEGESPFMLIVAPVKESIRNEMPPEAEKMTAHERVKLPRSSVPAITHVDYSARIQTIDAELDPLIHRLLTVLHEKHGCPLMVNTSFNVRGEPIVCTPREAFRCFVNTDMDYLVLGPFVIAKDDVRDRADREGYLEEVGTD